MRRPPKAHRALMLRTCLVGHGGFTWPAEGYVDCPDWDPTPVCGRGLHGLLWGEGSGTALTNWSAEWIVAEVDAREVVDLGGKVKVPRAWVVHVGDQVSATAYLASNGGAGRKIVGGTATAGDRGTATAGDDGTATAGYGGTIAVRWWGGQMQRYRWAHAEIGIDGYEPGVPYHVIDGRLVRKGGAQ